MTRIAWSKVPVITIYFWSIKLMTTAMGEAVSDSPSRAPTRRPCAKF